MAKLIKHDKCIEIDGVLYPLNMFRVTYDRTLVRLTFLNGVSAPIDLKAPVQAGETELKTSKEIFDWLKANSFKSGGGDGSGVSVDWDDIQGKPTGAAAQLLHFNADEVLTAFTANPNDLGHNPTGLSTGTQRLVMFSATDNTYRTSPLLSSTPAASSVVQRTGTGQVKGAEARETNDFTTLSQFQGIVNDNLTEEETSASLNTLYAALPAGSVVITLANVTLYRKVSATEWVKELILTI